MTPPGSLGESLMKELLDLLVSEHTLDNYKPSWLHGLELDRYYPSLRVAFEFQGEQHMRYSFSLHTSFQDFYLQVQHDLEKKAILQQKKICLVEITAPTLTPATFTSILSASLLEDMHPYAEERLTHSLLTRIERYQKGIEIHRKKELRTFLQRSSFSVFSTLPRLFDRVHAAYKGSAKNHEEKLLCCFLFLLSRNREVQVSIPVLAHILHPWFHQEMLQEHLHAFQRRGMLSLHPAHALITLSSSTAEEAKRCVTALLTPERRELSHGN